MTLGGIFVFSSLERKGNYVKRKKIKKRKRNSKVGEKEFGRKILLSFQETGEPKQRESD